QFDRGGDGYVVWLRGEEKPELSLSLLVTLPRGERKLELDFPDAVSSSLQLDVPAKVLGVSASGSPDTVFNSTPGKSEIKALDLRAGDFKLSWTEADAGTSNSTPLLDANMAVYARCELHS